MSNAIFPTLPGIDWTRSVSPAWSTKVQRSVAGREVRAAYFVAPIVSRSLSCAFLRSRLGYTELQTLIGFFNARRGMFDSWLYSDPEDNTVAGQVFGVGDGSTTQFQLSRTRGGHNEPVMNLNGTPVITGGAVASINNGLVTFSSAPASGQVLSWSGNFYYRCRFQNDTLEFNAIVSGLWDAKKIEFLSCLGNRL